MKQLDAKAFEGVEATLKALFFGDVASFVDETKPSPVWTGEPDPRWDRYVRWLQSVDRRTCLQHVNSWTLIMALTAKLAELPLMLDDKGQRFMNEKVSAMIEKLLHEIEKLRQDSNAPAHSVGTESVVH